MVSSEKVHVRNVFSAKLVYAFFSFVSLLLLFVFFVCFFFVVFFCCCGGVCVCFLMQNKNQECQ